MTKQQEKDINWLEQQIELSEKTIERFRFLGAGQSTIGREKGNIRRYKRFIDYIKNCDKSNKDSD